MKELSSNQKIDKIYDETFHPKSKRKQSMNFMIGIILGLLISLAIEGFVQFSDTQKELTSMTKPDIVYNISLNQLSLYEQYLLEARMIYLRDVSFLFEIMMLMGLIGLPIIWVVYNYINQYSNILFTKIEYKNKEKGTKLVEVLREIKENIENSQKFYKNKLMRIDDEYTDKIKLGKIIFKKKVFSRFVKYPIYIDIDEKTITIICPNTGYGEKMRDYLSESIVSKKRYKNIKSLKETHKGDYFSFNY